MKYIKDFLIKYHINDINSYSMEQLANLTKIAYNNYNIIDPSKTKKDNVKNVLEYQGNLDQDSNNQSTKYISPILSIKKVRKDDKGKKEILNLYKRANLHLQQKLYVPDKNYAENQQLIIDEVGKELEQYRKDRDNEKDVIHRKINSLNSFAFITLCKDKAKETIHSKPKEMDDFRKRNKLTEYIAYNSAKNNQFIRKENKKYCIK